MEPFSNIYHILSHKANLNRYKKIEITTCVLSDHHGLKLDFNNRNNRKLTNSWKLNAFPPNEKWVKAEIKKKLSQAWWRTPLIPVLGRQRQADFWVRGQPGLQSEFKDSQGYTEEINKAKDARKYPTVFNKAPQIKSYAKMLLVSQLKTAPDRNV